MCRFLLIKSKRKFNPQHFLTAFSQMCQKSRTPDGDLQNDGWGVAWETSGKWITKKSLNPIWKDNKLFPQLPETKILIVHARSAGFPDQKGIIEYNQPYIDDGLCFVFNGMLKGVRLNLPLFGKIGAQKIFSLIQLFKKQKKSLSQALDSVHKTLISHSRSIEGMNIGLSDGKSFYFLNQYPSFSDYFSLHYYHDKNMTLVCSAPILSYNWNKAKKGKVYVLGR